MSRKEGEGPNFNVTAMLNFLIYLNVSYTAMQVNSILRNVASKLEYDSDKLESLYERTAWYLEDKTGIPGSAYELFKKAVT